jgi:hypothetical protein
MDVPRAGVAKQKKKKRIMMVGPVVLAWSPHFRPLPTQTRRAEH